MKFKTLFFFIFLSSFLNSQNSVYYFKDVNANLNIKTIVNKQFKPLDKDILEAYSKTVYWFKIPAKQTKTAYVFSVLYERIKNANAYQNFKSLEKLKNQRYLSYQFSREFDVYIRVDPKLHAYIPIDLQTVEAAILKNNNQLLLNGFYYGFAFLVIIYNFFYFIVFKDDAFLYYSLFLSSMTFGVFLMDGMLIFYNTPPKISDILMSFNYVALAYFSSKFGNSFLFLDIYYPKLKKNSYIIGIIILILAILYVGFKNYYVLLSLNILVFSLLFIYWFSAVLLFKKNIYTKILAFGYVIILFSAIDFFILKFLGLSVININPITIKVGAFLEMIILSIAVLYRMKVLKEENKNMRNEIIKYSLEQNKSTNDSKNLKDLLQALSLREKEIFDLITLGKTNKEVSQDLNISVNTVKYHVKNIYEKLNIKSRKEVKNLIETT